MPDPTASPGPTESDFQYTIDADGITITKYTGTDAEVVIPSSIDGKPVRTIGNGAFVQNDSLIHLVISDGITKINYKAFYECKGLRTITIPASVTTIEMSAFWECYSLNTVCFVGSEAEWDQISIARGNDHLLLPDRTYSVGEETYMTGSFVSDPTDFEYIVDSDGITITAYTGSDIKVVIPDTIDGKPVIKIGNDAPVQGIYDVISLTIPDSVTSISYHALEKATSLISLTIPFLGLERGNQPFLYVLFRAFDRYEDLYSADVVPSSLRNVVVTGGTSIPEKAFEHCEHLTRISIPNSVTSIGESAFYGCYALQNITIPDSVTNIGSSAFYDCHALKDVTIPDGVMNIGTATFWGCSSLISITLPDSVTSIGRYAFYACSQLPNITIPGHVTSIDGCAFDDCSRLTKITIPNSVTDIGNYAFEECYSLKKVYYLGSAAEWDQITIGQNNNDYFLNAERIYLGNSALLALKVSAKPLKLTYSPGDVFTYEGIALIAAMKDGTRKNISADRCTFTGFNSAVIGMQTITVSYEGVQTSYSIKVTEPTVAGIRILQKPTKLSYDYAETIDLTGCRILVRYSDGRSEEMTGENASVFGYDCSIIGKQAVTLSYQGAKTTFTVLVNNTPVGITVAAKPNQLQYSLGESLCYEGLVISAKMADGTWETVDNAKLGFTGFDNTVPGVQRITVVYNGRTAAFSVRVTENAVLKGLNITKPSKLNYRAGEALNVAGMAVSGLYGDGSSKSIDLSQVTVSGYDPNTIGVQKLTVSYGGFSKTFSVRVS